MLSPEYLAKIEQERGLPSGLLSAVMKTESNGNPNAVSPRGALGAFQFMPQTAKQYGIDPMDPVQSAQGAGQMLSELLNKYDGSVPMALAGYNWGQGNVDRQGIMNAPPETQSYIQKVSSMLNPVSEAQAADNVSGVGPADLQPVAPSDNNQEDDGGLSIWDKMMAYKSGGFGAIAKAERDYKEGQMVKKLAPSGFLGELLKADPTVENYIALTQLQQNSPEYKAAAEQRAEDTKRQAYQARLSEFLGSPQAQNATNKPQALQEFLAMDDPEKNLSAFIESSTKQAEKQKELRTKAISDFATLQSLQESGSNIRQLAQSVLDNPAFKSGWVTGSIQGRLPSFGAKSADADADINNIKANAMIQTLATMKQQSQTGASGFGSTSAPEIDAIQNAIASLDTKQTKEKFAGELQKIISRTSNLEVVSSDKFKELYGDVAPDLVGKIHAPIMPKSKADNADVLPGLTPDETKRYKELHAKFGNKSQGQ